MTNLLFHSFAGNKISLEISKGNWIDLEDEMLSFLGIGRTPDIEACAPNGIYKNRELGYSIKVENLSIVDPDGAERKLIPKKHNEFYVDWLPVILRFENGGIVVAGSQICDRWSATGMKYDKVE